MDITLADVKEFFTANAENEEVKTYLDELASSLPVKPEKVVSFVETLEGRALLQPVFDREITKAIKTHDEKQIAKYEAEFKQRLADEMAKLHPEETPEQKRIREIEQKLEESEKARQKEIRERRIAELGHKYGVEPEFLLEIPFESPEAAQLYLERFKKKEEELKQKAINDYMLQNSPKPGSGEKDKQKIDISKLSPRELEQMELSGELDKVIGR